MPEGNHKTVPVQVWADIDEPIAPIVRHLNTIIGVRTWASCQGTIGEGGDNPYGPYVMALWSDDALRTILQTYDVTLLGNSWGHVTPR